MKRIAIALILAMMLNPVLAYAGTYTPHFGFYMPASGENNWGTSVAQNFWSIDQILAGIENGTTHSNNGIANNLTIYNGVTVVGNGIWSGSGTFGGNLTVGGTTSYYDGFTLTPPSLNSGISFLAFRGGGGVNGGTPTGTPRIYIMPSGPGESDVKAAIKVFSSDYYADQTQYSDLGLYYSAATLNGAFGINSKQRWNNTETSMAAAPIDLKFEDSASYIAAQASMQTILGNSWSITNVAVANSTAFTVTAPGHSLGNGVWVYISGITGSVGSALNNHWFVTQNVTASTFQIPYIYGTSGFSYTSGGTASALSSANAVISLGGPNPNHASLYSGIGTYFVGDAAFSNGDMLRFYNSTDNNNGSGIKMDSSNSLGIYNQGTLIGKATPSSFIMNTPLGLTTPLNQAYGGTGNTVGATSIVFFGAVNNIASASTNFLTPYGGINTNEQYQQTPVPASGTLDKLYCTVTSAPGGSNTITFSLRINAGNAGPTCTITGSATSCNDTTDSAAIFPGELVDMAITTSSSSSTNGQHCSMRLRG